MRNSYVIRAQFSKAHEHPLNSSPFRKIFARYVRIHDQFLPTYYQLARIRTQFGQVPPVRASSAEVPQDSYLIHI